VRLREPAVVSDLLDQLAELSRGANGVWVRLTSDLVALAARQRARPAGPPSRAEVSVILASQHGDVIRRARDTAIKRIFVTSHRWGHVGENFTLAPALSAAREKMSPLQFITEFRAER
jgi:cardiolipin synthase A/B